MWNDLPSELKDSSDITRLDNASNHKSLKTWLLYHAQCLLATSVSENFL